MSRSLVPVVTLAAPLTALADGPSVETTDCAVVAAVTAQQLADEGPGALAQALHAHGLNPHGACVIVAGGSWGALLKATTAPAVLVAGATHVDVTGIVDEDATVLDFHGSDFNQAARIHGSDFNSGFWGSDFNSGFWGSDFNSGHSGSGNEEGACGLRDWPGVGAMGNNGNG